MKALTKVVTKTKHYHQLIHDLIYDGLTEREAREVEQMILTIESIAAMTIILKFAPKFITAVKRAFINLP